MPRTGAAGSSAKAAKASAKATRRASRSRSRARGTAGVAAAAAAPAPAVAVAAASAAAAAVDPIYVYWTRLNAASEAAQTVYVSRLDGAWSASEPTELTRAMLEAQITATSAFCLPNVAEDYVSRQKGFAKNPILLMLSKTHMTAVPRAARSVAPTTPKSLGFIIARFMETAADGKGMYLDIICAEKGYGHKFIQFFHAMAFDNGARYVKLSSLANVLAYYYLKFNYRFRTSCATGPIVELSRPLEVRDYKARPAPEKTSSAYSDKDFMDFMYDKLYTEADLGLRSAEGCKDRASMLTRQQFKRADCAQDGFTMFKCSRGGARKTRRNRH